MGKKLLFIFLILFLTSTASAAYNPPNKFTLWSDQTQLRGAATFQRLVYPQIDGDIPGSIGPQYTQSDFNNLAKAGANFVVLSHPGLYNEKYPYAVNTTIQKNLDSLISMAQKANLYVVIGFRTGPGRSEFTFYREDVGTWFDRSYLNENIWKDKNAQSAYVSMWKYTANRYKNNPNVIGYELMVEPNANAVLGIDDPYNFYPRYKNTTYDWNILTLKISKSIRTVDKTTPILIGGLGCSDVYWLSSIKPTGDNRTVYIIHQYEPYLYTFQNVDKKGSFTLTYPGAYDVSGYRGTLNKAWLNNYFKPIDNFKKSSKAPVACTEFGCVRWEPGVDLFLNDQMDLFEARGMAYAVWVWDPANMPPGNTEDSFNFRYGQNMNSKTETESKMYTVIRNHWKKNN